MIIFISSIFRKDLILIVARKYVIVYYCFDGFVIIDLIINKDLNILLFE